jgi:hypothetical protein
MTEQEQLELVKLRNELLDYFKENEAQRKLLNKEMHTIKKMITQLAAQRRELNKQHQKAMDKFLATGEKLRKSLGQ